MKNREQALTLDAADPLMPLREQFEIPPGLIYLDGNSLGVTPKAAPASVQQVVTQEWAVGLIGSWNSAGWMDLAPRIGDKIARLVGAWAAVEHLRQVLECGEWREARFNQRAAVT